jgi:cytoskeletal protein RodZ
VGAGAITLLKNTIKNRAQSPPTNNNKTMSQSQQGSVNSSNSETASASTAPRDGGDPPREVLATASAAGRAAPSTITVCSFSKWTDFKKAENVAILKK